MPREIDAEVIKPNNPDNPWPVPMGYPVVLGDGKAYFVACASGASRGADLLDKLDEMQALQVRFEQGGEDGEIVKTSELIKKLTEFSLFNLALQYNDDTINRIVDSGALSAKEMGLMIAVTAGQSPGYEVTNKKK